MGTYTVNLTRVYKVTIDAEDESSAKEYVEFFLGDPQDLSNEQDRTDYKFNIQEIEMVLNESFDTEVINE